MIALPFSPREFFEVFERYNLAVWPAQLFLYGVAALTVAAVIGRERLGLVLALLAALWLWMGIVYHLTFFVVINPAARAFGIAFIAQAAMLLWLARSPARALTVANPLAVPVGKVLVAYALIGYPLVGYLSGHHYPATPTFGAPCPTTIFTIGVFLWISGKVPWWLLAIPVSWTIVGGSAAVQLGVPQDYGLPVAGVASLLMLLPASRSREDARVPARLG